MTGIRDAEASDSENMVGLSEAFRKRLVSFSPVFWRTAEDSFQKQLAWFTFLLPLEDTIALVYEQNGNLRGFLIGRLTAAPPVFAPGGPVCLIDDFCVAAAADWPTIGRALLTAVEERAKTHGAPLSVVACAHQDLHKRAFLAQHGFATTTEWHVRHHRA